MQVSVQFNPLELARLQKRLNDTNQAVGITVQWLCWDQARLAALDGVKYVAPWADGKPGTGNAQKKQGEGAVNNDIERIFATDDPQKYVMFTKKGNGGRYAREIKSGRVFQISQHLFYPEIEGLHLKLRTRRGRVNPQRRQAWVNGQDLKKYIAKVQSRVGSLKAAWLPALEYFAAKVGGSNRVPAWVKKHPREGSFTDSMTPDGNGKLVVTNAAHHGVGIRRDTVMFMNRRRNNSMKKYIPKRIQQIVDQFNANRTNIQPIRQNAAA